MKILSKISNDVILSNSPVLSRLIKEVISYNNIDFDEKMIFSSTSFYSIKLNEDIYLKEAFPLKLFIPDFILENFSLHNKEQKKVIIDFLKIFINELIYLFYYVELNKKIFNYTFSFQDKDINTCSFTNRRNMILLFEKFFSEEITIKECIPKKVKNNKQFKLGQNSIYSKYSKKSYLIGESFFSFLNRVLVSLQIHTYEFENLKKFLQIIGISNKNIIFSCPNMGRLKSYKINFIFEKNKCVSIFSIPNT